MTAAKSAKGQVGHVQKKQMTRPAIKAKRAREMEATVMWSVSKAKMKTEAEVGAEMTRPRTRMGIEMKKMSTTAMLEKMARWRASKAKREMEMGPMQQRT